jgi:LysM repeat protein
MKKQLLLLSTFIALASTPAFAQLPLQKVSQEGTGEVKIHRVAIGETMVIIAKKYMVLPQDIYELNPSAAEGLSAGMTLQIPVGKKVKAGAEEKNLDYEVVDAAAIKKQKQHDDRNLGYEVVDAETILKDRQKKQQDEKPSYTTEAKAKRTDIAYEPKTSVESTVRDVSHEVKPGETLTALAKKYNTTIAEITAANAKALKKGLQAGQTLVIPPAAGTADEVTGIAYAAPAPVQEKTTDAAQAHIPATHHVKPGETLHSLARKYNTTVAELTSANEKILKRGLQAGQTLTVPGGTVADEATVAATDTVIVPNHASYSDEPTGSAEHKVEAGETLHGLARKYNTSVEAITAANKNKLKKGLQAGQLIKIPVPIGIAVINEQ